MKTTFIPRLTAGVHTNSHGAGDSRRKTSAYGEPVILDRLFPRGRPGLWRLLICLAGALVIGIAVMLAVILHRSFGPSAGNPGDGGENHQQGEIPPVVTADEGESGDQTLPIEDEDTGNASTDGTSDGASDGASETNRNPAEETTADDGESTTGPSDSNGAEEGTDPPADGGEATEPPLSSGGEPGDGPGTGDESGGTQAPEPDTEPNQGTEPAPGDPPTVPEGCYPIQSVDMSESVRGAGYVEGEAGVLPDALPEGGLWGNRNPPTVLIINTHPYEAYGDGKAWYDPASGGLALADTPSDAEGTVALAASLGRTLRGMGVTVMHLRIAVSAEDSAADIYARTESVVRSYCRLYPDIGLVLDLRRSAELTPVGGILRTEGTLEGEGCAQVRISVSGDREEAATGRDLAVALALRRALWAAETTISRPVRVKAGSGIAGDLSEVCVLTLDVGAAGNVYAEAERLVTPLAEALERIVGDES